MHRKEDPRSLIPELCRQFYHLGWVTGTGGGISIKDGSSIYIAPSGVQKERMEAEDMFVYSEDGVEVAQPPAAKGFKASQCTPLFFAAYRLCSAGAVIHTHSQHAVRATLLFPGKEFVITHQEMIKVSLSHCLENLRDTCEFMKRRTPCHPNTGIRKGTKGDRLRYFDVLRVPIIDNTTHEQDLTEYMEAAIREYPETCAVLVRRHGVYVWGRDWVDAKTMTECYDYLFEMAVSMRSMGFDPAALPADHDHLVALEDEKTKKRARTEDQCCK